MEAAVEPAPVRAMTEEQMIRKPVVGTVPIGVNNVFAVRHPQHLITCPARPTIGPRGQKIVKISANDLICDTQFPQLFEGFYLPYSAIVAGFQFRKAI
jgi:hypothetical protein